MDLPQQLTDRSPTPEERKEATSRGMWFQTSFKEGKVVYCLKKRCKCS